MSEGDTMDVGTSSGADGEGVTNSVDVGEGVVNVTHGPIPAPSWPQMTMDLPASRGGYP